MLLFSACGQSTGWASHVFHMTGGMPNETLNSVDSDNTCRTEEQTEASGGGSGGGTDETGEIWCWFISMYDSSGNLTERHNTGNCWRM